MVLQQPPTKSGALSSLARHVILPSGIKSTAWPSVRDTCAGFGVGFDPWQDGTGRAILAKRADGTYAASIGGVVISIPRQVGKTFLIGALVFALCLLHPGLTVIWTAHRLRTAAETFASMQAFCRRAKVKAHVKKVVRGSGDEAIELHNGSRILFGARERGFGRGFADVDVLVFDEAQILTENAIDDMVPATNTADNPLLIFTGTPPKPTDPGEVFTRKRADAIAGESEDTIYIELSADEGADPRDRSQWAKANPSYPRRTPDAAMLRMLKNLSGDSFVREALGVWDPVNIAQIIPAAKWSACADGQSGIDGVPVFALEVSDDRAWSTFAAAGKSTSGDFVHVEVIDPRPGTGWVVDRAVELQTKWGGRIAINKASPAAALIPDLLVAEVKVVEVSTEDHAKSCGRFFDGVVNEVIRYRPQVVLDKAVRGAAKRGYGDAWVWSRRKSSVDISPLVAVTLAAGQYAIEAPARVSKFYEI